MMIHSGDICDQSRMLKLHPILDVFALASFQIL